jgi:hypothetical protein
LVYKIHATRQARWTSELQIIKEFMFGVWLYIITFCTCVHVEEAFGKGKSKLAKYDS